MWKKYILFSFSLCVSSVAVAQQNTLLEKYRSMAVEYSHDLKAADKNIAASIELEKAAQKDLYPKLSGNANFQYTGNPLELTLDLPSTGNPVTFEGKDLKYGASVSLTQPIYTGGRLLETIRLARYRHNVSGFQEEYIRSGIYLQTDMQYWNTVARTEIVRISDDYRNSIASLSQGWVSRNNFTSSTAKLTALIRFINSCLQGLLSFIYGHLLFHRMVCLSLRK